ncbi:MAG: DUF4192 domain-containing protein [Marmoricola sp.]
MTRRASSQPSQPARHAPEAVPPYVAREPVDLVALAPQVVGFRPEESVVLMTFGGPSRAFHARIDLPSAAALQEQVADLLLGAMLRNGLDRAAVLLYSKDRRAARRQGRILLDRLRTNGVDVIDVIRVERDRYFFPLEGDETGTPYDLGSHPLTARAVFEGRVVADSREALAESLVGGDDQDRAEILAAATAWADRLLAQRRETGALARARRAEGLWVQGRVRRFMRTQQPLSADQAGRLLACVAVIPLRDVAWAEIRRDNAEAHVALWRDLLRRAPTELVPAAAGLLSFAAWLAGDGALAWCAVDRCVEVEPGYSMAACIGDVLSRAIPPSTWTGIVAEELEVFGPTLDP